ncbi:MAG TPA: hypothetical protein VJK54_08560 [Chthoniobacterales bacterium]|nr:hypothetical protein [Chthoniobacterales bacterium]
MGYVLFFTNTAQEQLAELESRSISGLSKQVKKTLGYLETNPRHPSLRTHE